MAPVPPQMAPEHPLVHVPSVAWANPIAPLPAVDVQPPQVMPVAIEPVKVVPVHTARSLVPPHVGVVPARFLSSSMLIAWRCGRLTSSSHVHATTVVLSMRTYASVELWSMRDAAESVL